MINRTKIRVSESQKLFTCLGNIRSRSQFGGYSLSANGVMFALVSDGDLYLRATPENEMVFRRMGMESLIYRKRGIAITLRYFKVDQKLWQDTALLITLAKRSLQGMLDDIKSKKEGGARLKDLPNISLNLERLLWQVGISTSSQLRAQGACMTYLKLKSVKHSLGLNVLIALEAAIQGFHEAALPMASREVLMKWFKSHQRMIDTTAR
ncbi:TfoX/Sxy family DNA transformation protein [Ewingella americana]|uniref:TfoX/Sxy family DNA transformation protein n=1 Tax=Ewingella americana TaxID=41202 RepID=UPI00163A5D1E|nr:TfoX/Sxy family DNA transformation protein [Ewingella americana]QMV52241.1 TfoX/Sxy family DNA transformation protein [Ewingella americana]